MLKKAEEAVKKLEAEKNDHEATIIKAEEAKIKKLITEIGTATDATKISHIESNLKHAEEKLNFELQMKLKKKIVFAQFFPLQTQFAHFTPLNH